MVCIYVPCCNRTLLQRSNRITQFLAKVHAYHAQQSLKIIEGLWPPEETFLMIYKSPGPKGKVRVLFYLPASFWADTIHLVGDFNDWDSTATPLHLDDNCWSITLDLDAGRSYEYRYLVNNTDWVNDWQADRFTPSELGGDNSVVVTLLEEAMPYTELNARQNARQRPSLRIIQGGRQEKQAV